MRPSSVTYEGGTLNPTAITDKWQPFMVDSGCPRCPLDEFPATQEPGTHEERWYSTLTDGELMPIQNRQLN